LRTQGTQAFFNHEPPEKHELAWMLIPSVLLFVGFVSFVVIAQFEPPRRADQSPAYRSYPQLSALSAFPSQAKQEPRP
jgi:hypothetical protein